MDKMPPVSSDIQPLNGGNTAVVEQFSGDMSSIIAQPETDVPSVEDIWNDSLIVSQDSPVPVETYLNPTSLIAMSMQRMLESFHIHTPPSLMQLCCDYISWEPNTTYPCSIRLPCTMLCAGYIAELQRM